MTDVKIFSGNSNLPLAISVASILDVSLADATVSNYSDSETMIEVNENVRGKNVFILQSISSPVNDNLIEALFLADALKRASAANITAIIPYFGYARQDRRVNSQRVPIAAKVVADMFAGSGVDHCLTLDLHTEQIQGLFKMPVDNIYASRCIYDDIKKYHSSSDSVIVSPDIGGVLRARSIAKMLKLDFAVIDKRRTEENDIIVSNIIGDVANKHCIIVDDIVDTASTLAKAANILKDQGAKSVVAYCTHPVLSGNALSTISSSSLDELVITDSILCGEEVLSINKIRQINLGNIIAEAITRLLANESISSMFIN